MRDLLTDKQGIDVLFAHTGQCFYATCVDCTLIAPEFEDKRPDAYLPTDVNAELFVYELNSTLDELRMWSAARVEVTKSVFTLGLMQLPSRFACGLKRDVDVQFPDRACRSTVTHDERGLYVFSFKEAFRGVKEVFVQHVQSTATKCSCIQMSVSAELNKTMEFIEEGCGWKRAREQVEFRNSDIDRECTEREAASRSKLNKMHENRLVQPSKLQRQSEAENEHTKNSVAMLQAKKAYMQRIAREAAERANKEAENYVNVDDFKYPPELSDAIAKHISTGKGDVNMTLERASHACFHDLDRSGVITRKDELQRLMGIVVKTLRGVEACRTIWVTGRPGTGKTHCCRHVMQLLGCYENWKMMGKAVGVINRNANACGHTIVDEVKQLDKTRETVLLLDDVDDLGNRVLCKLFETAVADESKLIVIAIGNIATAVDKKLKKAKSAKVKPERVIFRCYTATEVQRVMVEQLPLVHQKMVDPRAAEHIAKVVVKNNGGDIRIALKLLQNAFLEAHARELEREPAEDEEERQPLLVRLSHASKVCILHVSAQMQDVDALTITQQQVLLALCLTRRVRTGLKYEAAKSLLRKLTILGCARHEFPELVSALESAGLVKLPEGGPVDVRVHEDDLRVLFKDKPGFAALLDAQIDDDE